jgi:hypothetical protein
MACAKPPPIVAPGLRHRCNVQRRYSQRRQQMNLNVEKTQINTQLELVCQRAEFKKKWPEMDGHRAE